MKKRKIVISIVCTVIAVTVTTIIKYMEEKEYWVIGAYPVNVNDEVKEGYKVIGRYKLWNPRPCIITLEDAYFINSKLHEWLAERYSKEEIDRFLQPLNNQEIVNKLQYAFTMLHQARTIEADFYLLTLSNKEKSVNIYVGKGIDSNPYSPPRTQKLIYPFYDEEWHKNISNPTPYKPGDLW